MPISLEPKVLVTLLSVAIASKWDEPEKIKIFMVFTSKCMLSVAGKDVLPTTLQRFLNYEYLFHCDNRYEERTSQRLQDRIKQHVPKWLQKQAKRLTRSLLGRSSKQKRNNPDCTSAIGQQFSLYYAIFFILVYLRQRLLRGALRK